jgi:hypothetical protein
VNATSPARRSASTLAVATHAIEAVGHHAVAAGSTGDDVGSSAAHVDDVIAAAREDRVRQPRAADEVTARGSAARKELAVGVRRAVDEAVSERPPIRSARTRIPRDVRGSTITNARLCQGSGRARKSWLSGVQPAKPAEAT